ncbi:flagellar filament capping protein FliD [Cohnella xylanilytica]|uniref:Flagellar hook-associated protein 2 n=1 Tax=Cohnella xylanilytica TaxID=557555 RepID=A0A841U262_9BACL|nr:flagellar filament capping protein FliD [Cohnella xylanilytica]MBB6692190.1 flagellar filament capping protein FliD [Cohnella xylanilytica]
MSTIKLGGLATGIDTDTIVKQLMSAKREPLNKLNQQKTKLEWQQEAYRDITIKLVDLRNNKLANLKLASNLNTQSSSVTGNTTAVSVKAQTGAVAGSMSIEVHSLATAASATGASIGKNIDTSKSLADLGLLSSGTSDININGTTITLNSSDKLSDVISKINSTSGANVTAYFDNVSGKLALTAKATGASGSLTYTGELLEKGFGLGTQASASTAASSISKSLGTDASKTLEQLGLATGATSLTINGTMVNLTKDMTLSDVITKINAEAMDVTASFDSATGKLSITSKSNGSNLSISGDLATKLDLSTSKAGADADVTINGIRTTRSSNTFTENGVQITLNAASNGVASTVTTKLDTSKFVDAIKSYITAYNEILDAINPKLSEKRNYSYEPLTEDQKKDMKEEEIELWEKKAKQGLLKNDTILSSLVSNMRLGTMTDVNVNGTNVNITSLGITTGTWEEKGKLKLDEAKLTEALEKNPDQVIGFFTQFTAETDPKKAKLATTPDSGLFNRISNELMTALNSLADKAGTSRVSTSTSEVFNPASLIGEQIRNLDIRIANLNSRLTIIENNYYKQFSSMETAVNKLNAQSSSLFS